MKKMNRWNDKIRAFYLPRENLKEFEEKLKELNKNEENLLRNVQRTTEPRRNAKILQNKL